MTETLAALTEELHHPDQNVRSRAAVSLGKLADVGTLPILIDALSTEPDLFVREDITWALVRMGDAAVQPLIELTRDANPAARHNAVHALGKIGDPRALGALIHALQDSDMKVQLKAAFALTQLGDARAVEPLVNLLGHEDSEVESAIASALEFFGPFSIEPLIHSLTDARWQVREQAADVLGLIGSRATIPALMAALRDEHWQVRFASVAALGKIGGENARIALEQMQADPNERVRSLVPKVMRRIKA
jgi:HEAT repeat protein